jgi:beta-glucosidase
VSDLHIGKADISAADSLHVTVKVKNTGGRAGGEVVQLYVHYSNTQIEMPEKLLRGFQKVYLQAGEEQVLEFVVPSADLAYYNVTTNQWEIEKRGYKVSVGNSSEEAGQLSGDFSFR